MYFIRNPPKKQNQKMKIFLRPRRYKLSQLSQTFYPFKPTAPQQPEYPLVKFLGLKEEPRDSDNLYHGLTLP